MNKVSIEVGTLAIIISVVCRLVAALIYLLVVRLALKETNVRNGLLKLRRQLVATSTILFFMNTVGLSLLYVRTVVTVDVYRFITDTVTVLNSIGFLVVGWIKYKIYTQQYTPENIAHHARFERYEKKNDLHNKVHNKLYRTKKKLERRVN